MTYRQIKIGANYVVKSLGEMLEVTVTEKKHYNGYYRVEYAYPYMNVFGCTKGWQFCKDGVFPNILPVE